MQKKLLAAILCISFTISLSRCQNVPETVSPVEEPPMEISIAYTNVTDNLIGDPVQKYIEKKFNIRFTPVAITSDNYDDELQKLAVQNKLPDIFTHDILGTSTYEKWIQTNKIRPIPKKLSMHPELSTHLSQQYIDRFKYSNGFFYAIPRMTYDSEFYWCLDRCIMVRKDWMETLNLSIPQNWEEFEAMLTAFVTEDPDGNGVDDTEGITSPNMNTLEALFLSVFPELSNTERGWIFEDGQWMPVYNSKKTGAALQKLQELQRKGLLSSKLGYTSRTSASEDFANGKVGAICMQYFGLIQYFASHNMLELSDDYILVIPPWPTEDGKRFRFTTSLHWSEIYFGSNVDDLKMEKILDLLNWALSDEFQLLCQYGLEDIDWKYEGDEIVLLNEDAVSPLIKYPSLNTFSYLIKWNQDTQYEDNTANSLLYGKENVLNAQKLLKWYEDNTERVNYNYDIIFMSTPSKNNLVTNRVIQEKMLQVISGPEDAITAWPKVLDELKQTTSLEQAIKEVTSEAGFLKIQP